MSRENGHKANGDGLVDLENELSDDEYNNRRRLKAINDARERVSEIALDVERALMMREVDRYRASWAIHAAVKMFIRETQWVLANHPEGEKHYYEKPIGEMTLPRDDAQLVEPIPSTTVDDGVVKFYGLYSILECPREIEVGWTEVEHSHVHGRETTTKQDTMTVPMNISMHAYDVLVNLLGESDLNLTWDGGRSLGSVTPDIGDDL